MELIFTIILTILGLIALSKGSDWLTDSIIPVAKRLGTSHSAIGIIVVSIVVSLPEIIIALIATYLGHPVVGLGVVFGSIMCNIGLMTGLVAMFHPLKVERQLIVRDGVFSVIFAIVVLATSYDGQITRIEGLALVMLFIPYAITVWEEEKNKTIEHKQKELDEAIVELDTIGLQMIKVRTSTIAFVLGSALLLGGSYMFTEGMASIANTFGISDLIIGLTLGAIGPSLPNIVAAYRAGQRGMDSVVISETLGSNIFTLLVTLGILSLSAPLIIQDSWLRFDIPAMVIMSLLLLTFMVTSRKLSRIEGGILFSFYIFVLLYQIILYGFV